MDTTWPIYHFKILVPAAAAGRIIGKGGTTIAQLQKDAGARVKMSKASEFYPGTTERVCLISGPIEGILKINDFFMENFSSTSIKILVPNSTAGMIIGRGGSYIKQIKEESGAYVQISQKCTDLSLPERCVTIVGELENIRRACAMILCKIVEDVGSSIQSTTTTATAAAAAAATTTTLNGNNSSSINLTNCSSGTPPSSSSISSLNMNSTLLSTATSPTTTSLSLSGTTRTTTPATLALTSSTSTTNSSFSSTTSTTNNSVNNYFLSRSSSSPANCGSNINTNGNNSCNGNNVLAALNPAAVTSTSAASSSDLNSAQIIESIKLVLRVSGYGEDAVSEITSAMSTLASYGVLGVGLGLL